MPAWLAGSSPPTPRKPPTGIIPLHNREHYRTSFRFYTDAFKQDPKLADNLQEASLQCRLLAALAAAGKGKDADGLAEKERALLRQQALDWLLADLKAYSGHLDKDPKTRPAIQQTLAHWREDDDLAGLRATAAIDKLPEAEREPWRKLWADVDALLKRAREN